MADEARSRVGRGVERGLGRGLASLIGDAAATPQAERSRGQRKAPIEWLNPNPRNPRRTFSASELDDLTASVREHGVIQPIVVRAAPGNTTHFEIIAGERRWRAAQNVGLHEVPITLTEATDERSLEIAIIENVQREDLNAIDEAQGYQALLSEFKRTQEDIARMVGKSRSHIANTMRLLKLPETVRARIAGGDLTAGHARALIGAPDPTALATRIVEEGLTVRQAEELAREAGVPSRKPPASANLRAVKDADTLALEKRVSDALGLRVSIEHRDSGGVVSIRYRDLEQLDGIIQLLDAK